MSTIVTRAGKGSALTHTEVDANFTNLNTDKIEAAQSVTLTNKTIALGSNTVSGTTAQFNTALTDGDFATLAGSGTLTNKTISGSNNTLSNIGNSSLTNSSVTLGSTSVTLGSTVTSVSGLSLTGGAINNATIGATTPSSGAFTTLSATGVTTVQAGTAAAPAITTSGDTNTGIFFPAADTIAFTEGGVESMRIDASGRVGIGTDSPATTLHLKAAVCNVRLEDADTSAYANVGVDNSGSMYLQADPANSQASSTMYFSIDGTERMRLDSSGNLGLGVTPSAWNTLTVQQVKNAHIGGYVNNGYFGANCFYDGTWKYIATGSAHRMELGNGQFQWHTAASGTAGNTITFTQAMTLDASGNLGIGTSSPTSVLDILNATPKLTLRDAAGRTLVLYAPNSVDEGFIGTTSSHALPFRTNNTERMRIDSSGNVGIGTSSPLMRLHASGSGNYVAGLQSSNTFALLAFQASGTGGSLADPNVAIGGTGDALYMRAGGAERARITSGGSFLIGGTSTEPEGNTGTDGIALTNTSGAYAQFAVISKAVAAFNRMTTDGTIVSLRQAGIEEGTISVSGTTVSYNGGHLARWSQLLSGQRDESIVKGTVLSNLDEMCEWLDAEGNPLPNEQLNRMKVSDVEGDTNVAGVFVNWDNDDQDNPYDMNIAMTGDMIIRIAQGVTVQKGDLLMSAGDGTAKPQGDDIVRAKTIAKVTSNHVTCTYDDGSYCVPCVLMAC